LCITLSVVYLLRTGSRGCFLAALVYGVLIFVISKKKLIVLLLAVAVGVVGIATLPAVTLRRLMLLGFDDASADEGAVGSTLQRKELFRRSIQETLTHPIFGVGPGQFAVAVAGEQEKKGERPEWLGTHNSYTQVSAECGIPAFVCYCAVLLLCFRLNYTLYRATRDHPAYRDVAALTFTLLSATVVYSVATFFFHMAYTGSLPWVSGLTLAVYFAAKPSVRRDLNPNFR
jgi:O-antigen ligase